MTINDLKPLGRDAAGREDAAQEVAVACEEQGRNGEELFPSH
jgi:hypothetical protein